jgi:hypothetical protein
MVDVGVHSLTVSDYLETWLAGKHALKPKTLALYRDFTTNYLVPNLGEVRLLELRAHHLDRMYLAIALGRRDRPLSPATIRRLHAVLRSALNSAVKRRLLRTAQPSKSSSHRRTRSGPSPGRLRSARPFFVTSPSTGCRTCTT